MIQIFGKYDCQFCDRATELCRQYSLDFVYKGIDDNWEGEKHRAELMKRKPDAKTVPQIWWYDKYIGGFSELAAEIENTRNFGDGKL
jgi:glutaredoxin 3